MIRAFNGKLFRQHPKLSTALLWSITLLASIFLVINAVRTMQAAEARLHDQAVTLAHLIAERSKNDFLLADMVLRDMLDDLTWDDFNGPIANTPRRAEIRERMQKHRSRMRGIASFTIIGADGIRRLGVVNKDGTDLSWRTYFQQVKMGKSVYISGFEKGLASGKAGIHIARRFQNESGEFGGAIVLNLAADDVFFRFYNTLELGGGSSTALRDASNILIQYPADPPMLSADRRSANLVDALTPLLRAGAEKGVIEQHRSASGAASITAFERLPDTNFWATVSLPRGAGISDATVLTVASGIAILALIIAAFGSTAAIQAADERRQLIAGLNSAAEAERRLLSSELHDVVNAMLIGIRLDLRSIRTHMNSAPASPLQELMSQSIASLENHVKDVYDTCRSIVMRLRPEVLDVLGLEQALAEVVRGFNSLDHGCHVEYVSQGCTSHVPSDIAISVYRIVQESLSNVMKHADAKNATVTLLVDERRLQLRVEDDGVGLPPSKKVTTFGIVGMRERVASHGGAFELRCNRNGFQAPGCAVIVEIPLPI